MVKPKQPPEDPWRDQNQLLKGPNQSWRPLLAMKRADPVMERVEPAMVRVEPAMERAEQALEKPITSLKEA